MNTVSVKGIMPHAKCGRMEVIMNRYKVKTGVLVCYLMAVFVTGCEGPYSEAGPEYNYRRSAPADTGNSDADPYLSEMRKMTKLAEERARRERMREWDELGERWDKLVEETKRQADEETLKTHLYLQR